MWPVWERLCNNFEPETAPKDPCCWGGHCWGQASPMCTVWQVFCCRCHSEGAPEDPLRRKVQMQHVPQELCPQTPSEEAPAGPRRRQALHLPTLQQGLQPLLVSVPAPQDPPAEPRHARDARDACDDQCPTREGVHILSHQESSPAGRQALHVPPLRKGLQPLFVAVPSPKSSLRGQKLQLRPLRKEVQSLFLARTAPESALGK